MNIDNLTDDVLGAYLDGELSPEARAALERRLLSEPGARVRLDRMRESDDRLRRAFALPAAADGDPLLRLLTADDDGATPLRSPATRWRRFAVPAGLAMAAALGGFAVGLQFRAPASDAAPATAPGIALSAPLSQALDRGFSGESRGGVHLVLSFRGHDGAPCRQFELHAPGHVAEGVACRDAAHWRMAAWNEQAVAAGADASGYHTAGGDDSPLEAAVDALDASGPLAREEEAALIARGW